MKHSKSVHFILTVIILFLLSCSSDKPLQPGDPLPEALGWVEQVSPVIDKRLAAVDFINKRQGWIVGGGGTILHTNDGGQNWSVQESGVVSDLTAVKFIDIRNGWAVGRNGAMLRTTNGGRKWTKLESVTTTTFEEISFLDNKTGWISGRGPYALLHTSDGGESWQSLPANGLRLVSSLNFTDEQNGIALADWDHIVSTNDGGRNWSILSKTPIGYVWNMDIMNGTSGIAVSSRYGQIVGSHLYGWNDVLYATTDGGNTWTKVYDQEGSWLNGGSAFLFSEVEVSVVGGFGLFSSIDFGETLTLQFAESGRELYGASFIDPETGWVVGADGLILHTTNGGVTPIP